MKDITKFVRKLPHQRVLEHTNHVKQTYLFSNVLDLSANYNKFAQTGMGLARFENLLDFMHEEGIDLWRETKVGLGKIFDKNLNELVDEAAANPTNPYSISKAEGILKNVLVRKTEDIGNKVYSGNRVLINDVRKSQMSGDIRPADWFNGIFIGSIDDKVQKYNQSKNIEDYDGEMCDIRFTPIPGGRFNGSYRHRRIIIEDITEPKEDSFLSPAYNRDKLDAVGV